MKRRLRGNISSDPNVGCFLICFVFLAIFIYWFVSSVAQTVREGKQETVMVPNLDGSGTHEEQRYVPRERQRLNGIDVFIMCWLLLDAVIAAAVAGLLAFIGTVGAGYISGAAANCAKGKRPFE